MRRHHAALLVGTVLSVGACGESSLAYGDVNSIIVGAAPEVWAQVEDTVRRALAPSIVTTVREEEIFQVTHLDPADSAWVNLRRFQSVFIIGSKADWWVEDALQRAGRADVEDGTIVKANDIWARGQAVLIAVLAGSDDPSPLLAQLDEIRADYVEGYRRWAMARMFASGRDSALADTLLDEAGFSLLLPNVYQWSRRDSVFIFRNDNPDPSELIRQLTVTWVTQPTEWTPADLLAWRDDLSRTLYDPVQVSDTALMNVRTVTVAGASIPRVQAVWKNPPEADWPAAGNFLLQAIPCPALGRTYLVDAWLYAPGKDKFEYLVQLESILDSFRCRAT